ncbi:MAG TPA: signal recognition particle-docking protein FtsY [Acidimicrobiaceae bacterium]|nr:signal recognition particle-docking protein FtsY [Acidimicrobiaceae bacterium]
MNTSLLIVVFLVVMLSLAVLPWIHRAWTTRKTSENDVEVGLEIEEEPISTDIGEKTHLPSPETMQAPEEVAPAASVREKLSKARTAISGRLKGIKGGSISPSMWEELEELLISADVGVETTLDVVDRLRETAQVEKLETGTELLDALKRHMKEDLSCERELSLTASEGSVPVWLFVGVNGVGKTTSIGKVARRLTDEGSGVLLAAGDTFRAAAAEQLEKWALLCDADFVRGSEGADPSSVIFDAVEAAKARKVDVVLGDTAGRLHNKVNLMQELTKVRRVADREPGQVCEVLLVIDATTGQNGLSQAQEFTEAAGVTGIVLTKLDGSAKGGIVFAIEKELGLPVKLIGLGEGDGDLVDFDPEQFVEAIFGDD